MKSLRRSGYCETYGETEFLGTAGSCGLWCVGSDVFDAGSPDIESEHGSTDFRFGESGTLESGVHLLAVPAELDVGASTGLLRGVGLVHVLLVRVRSVLEHLQTPIVDRLS